AAARGASARAPARTLKRSVRSEQRRLGQKEPPPGGLPRFSVLASLLLGHSPTAGDAPSSRLARTEKRGNKRGLIYGTGYLVALRFVRFLLRRGLHIVEYVPVQFPLSVAGPAANHPYTQ